VGRLYGDLGFPVATIEPLPSSQVCDARTYPLKPKAGLSGPPVHPSIGWKDYICVVGFAVKMLLKLSRYRRKTSIHSTQATRAGAMLAGASVT
jgi:hypothetical protein